MREWLRTSGRWRVEPRLPQGGWFLVVLAGVQSGLTVPPPVRADAPPASVTVEEVRWQLKGPEFAAGRAELERLGDRAFDVFEKLLGSTDTTPQEASRILFVIRQVNADRSRFVRTAVQHLAHKDPDVRWEAVQLLGKIGTAADASPVVALLSDGEKVADQVIPYAAAKTLAAIGGRREVVAMDAWLLGASHRDDPHLRAHVKTCRDELQKRLEAAAKAKDKG
jgi:HEAT repeat protein